MTEHSRGGKIFRTVVLIITWICMGLYIEISGPTLQELAYRAGVGYEKISLAISGQDYGFLLGAIMGGVLIDFLQRWSYLQIAASCILAGLAVVSIPWISSAAVMGVFFSCCGIALGITNVAGTHINISLWKEKASAPLHIMHVGFGIGSFIVPQIASPFMNPKIKVKANEEDSEKCADIAMPDNSSIPQNSSQSAMQGTTTATPKELTSEVQFAFIIVACACVAMGLFYVVLQLLERRLVKTQRYLQTERKEEPTKKSLSLVLKQTFCPSKVEGQKGNTTTFFMLAITTYYITAEGLERVFGRFLYSFARDEMCFSVDEAAWLSSSFWISFAVGRFTGFVVANFVPMRIMVVLEAIGCCTIVLLVSTVGPIEPIALWVLVQIAGLLMGPLFPSGTAFANRYAELKGIWLTLINVGASIGGLLFMWVAGRLFKNWGARSVLYLELGLAGLHVIVVLITFLIARKLGDRFEKESVQQNMHLEGDEEVDKY